MPKAILIGKDGFLSIANIPATENRYHRERQLTEPWPVYTPGEPMAKHVTFRDRIFECVGETRQGIRIFEEIG
jgi:hypothetical protein